MDAALKLYFFIVFAYRWTCGASLHEQIVRGLRLRDEAAISKNSRALRPGDGVFVCVIGLGFAATIGARSDEPENPTVVQVGPGTCIGKGAMPFATFIAEVTEDKSVGEWRFNPDTIRAEEGTKLVLVNRGGELHTFTRVAEFGGGFVAPTALNVVGSQKSRIRTSNQ